MTKLFSALSLAAGLLLSSQAGATVLFQDSFQTNLNQWGPSGNVFNGAIKTAPDGQKALTFTGFAVGQDMTTVSTFTSTTGTFTISFDFMTTSGHTSRSGAFVYASGATASYDNSGWILSDTPFGSTKQFADSPTWEHISYTFQGTATKLLLEDWADGQSTWHGVNNLFFRNMVLTDNAEGVAAGTLRVSPVPEPASLALLGAGLLGLAGVRRRKRSGSV